MMKLPAKYLPIILSCICSPIHPASLADDPVEFLLYEIMVSVQIQHWEQARMNVERLISQFPHFKPAQLLQQNIDRQTDSKIISPIALLPEEDEYTRENLYAEISARLKYRSDVPPKNGIPAIFLAF